MGQLSYGLDVVSAAANLGARTVEIGLACLSWLFFVAGTLPWLIFTGAIFFLMWPAVSYSDTFLESVDSAMRFHVYPFYHDGWPRQLVQLLRLVYNPLICWYNSFVWYPFGSVQNVIIPLALRCGLSNVARLGAQVLLRFFVDFVVGYVASFQFLYVPFNFAPFCNAWVAFWSAWQSMLCCMCGDLCIAMRLQPLVYWIPIVNIAGLNPLAIFGSNQLGDYQFCCAMWSAFNGLMAIVQIFFRILAAILTGQFSTIQRPNFDIATEQFCQAVSCLIRSVENSAQYFADNFLPFQFNFIEMFCVVDGAVCVALKIVNFVFTLLVHIDQIIFYPDPAYWGTEMKWRAIEILNLIAPVRYYDGLLGDNIAGSYFLSTTDQAWPGRPNSFNPLYNRRRLTDCACILIQRVLCDPTDPDTACYTPGVDALFGNFKLCCIAEAYPQMVVDIAAALFDWTLHFYNWDIFFTFLDKQVGTRIVGEDIGSNYRCFLNVFELVPVVGHCMAQGLYLGYLVWYLAQEFLIRVAIGLFSLPYFIINNKLNFITEPHRARNYLFQIMEYVDKEGATDTMVNCLCFVLNFGIRIPPIPCSSCVPGHYLTPPDTSRGNIGGLTPILQYDKGAINPLFRWSEWRDATVQNNAIGFDLNTTKTLMERFDESTARFQKRIADLLAEHRRDERNMVSPTEPPIASCSPNPPCFDLCCIGRTGLQTAVIVVSFVTDVIDNLVHDRTFFTDGRFETYLTTMINKAFQLLTCVCNILNLVIPVTIPGGRPDICCWVMRVGDLVACILLTIINGIKSLALGAPDFVYFTQGMFLNDVDMMFDITFQVVVCVCNLVRSIFFFFALSDMDICCIIENGALVLIELLRWIFQMIITFGTIGSTGLEYWRDPLCLNNGPSCDPNVERIGFIKQGDIFIDALFGHDGGTCKQGVGGVTTCLCQLVNTIIPARPRPGEPTSATNCPYADLCCLLRTAAGALAEASKFLLRTLASLWQAWEGSPAQPTAFFNFFFCNENDPVALAKGCGRTQPMVDAVVAFFTDCPCEVFHYLDSLLSQYVFFGFDCFCGKGGNGLFPNLGSLARVLINKVVDMLRNANRKEYWLPGGYPQNSEFDTWSIRFFTPIAREICKTLGSLACFLNALLRICNFTRTRVFQSIVAWFLEVYLRLLQFVEGFALAFVADGASSCYGGSDSLYTGYYGMSIGCLGAALTNLFVLPVDLLIADSSIVCQDPCTCTNVNDYTQVAFPDTSYDGYICVEKNTPFPTSVSDARECASKGLCKKACAVIQPGLGACFCYGSKPTTYYNKKPYTAFDGTAYEQAVCLVIGTPVPGSYLDAVSCNIAGNCRPSCGMTVPQILPPSSNVHPNCIKANVPSCTSGFGTYKVDGVLLALTRHLSCLMGAITPVLGKVFNVVNIFLSIVWQFTRPFFLFAAAIFTFLFSFFASLGSGNNCACYNGGNMARIGALCYQCHDSTGGLARSDDTGIRVSCTGGDCFAENCFNKTGTEAYGNEYPANPQVNCGAKAFFDGIGAIFQAFGALLTAPISIPTEPPLVRRRNGRSHQQVLKDYPVGQSAMPVLESVQALLEGFDEQDCNTDPVACACRLLGDGVFPCGWDYEAYAPTPGSRTGVVPSESVVLKWISDKFTGDTACDKLVDYIGESGSASWAGVPAAQRKQWHACVVDRVRGERLHLASPRFPIDYYYRHDGTWEVFTGLAQDVQRYIKERKEESKKREEHARKRMPNTRQFEERETRFARFDEELANRRHYMAKRMTNHYEVDATQPWGQLILFLDGVEHKLYSGYYQHLYEKARTRYESGATFLDPYEAFRNVLTVALHSMHSSSMAVYRLPDLMNAHLDLGQEVFSAVRHLGTRSIYEWIQDGLSYWGKPVSAGISQLGSLMDHMTSQSGFYRAFTRNTTTAFEWPLNSPATILDHVWNNGRSILTDMRDEPDKYPSPADTFRKAREVIIKRYTEPYGGPNSVHQKRIEMNWISLQSIGWKVYHTLYPSQVTRQVYQRFILDSNCDLLDGLVNLLVSIVQYCASVTTRNQAKMMDLREDNMFELYMAKADKMRHKIVGWAHDYGSRPAHPERPKTDDDPSYHRDSKGHIRKKWIWSDGGDELSWSKPRLAPVNETRRPRLDDKTWKHAQMHKRSLAAQAGDNIWFYDTVLAWVDGITGWNLERGVSDWVVSFKAWIANPSVSACDYPNVGFRYWVTFWLRCEFPTLDCPNSNLNCSIGIGFEEALKWVLIVSAVLFLAMPFILPQTMLPLTAVSAFILYLIVWPALAWHYSPRCWLMSPSIVYGGVSIPVFGPMAPPALPQCAMDEVSNFLDKWISSCYSWLWPACMVIGDPCPAAPTSIDLANCKDVGIGDGLTNLVYIGYKLFGTSFTDVVTGFFETCLTSWSPFLSPWIRRTVEHFVNPTDTQQCRMDICFWPTLPAILFPFMLLGYAIALLSFLLPPIMAWIGSLFTLILLSPLGAISPTSDGNFFNSTSSSSSPAAVGDAIVRISQQIGDRQRRRRQARRAAELTHAVMQIRHEQHLRHRGVGRRRESEE